MIGLTDKSLNSSENVITNPLTNEIDITSDIHLEHYKNESEIISIIDKIAREKRSRILCLLGDIGYPKQPLYKYFIIQMMKIYDYIFLLTGNHEYYNKESFDKIDMYIDKLCRELNIGLKEPKVYFMNRKAVEIDNYLFIGCTLWSNINDFEIVKSNINDYYKIHKTVILYDQKRKVKIEPQDVKNWFIRDRDWINERINNNIDKKIIVLTHHAPIIDPNVHPPEFRNDILNQAYSSDLEYLINKPVVAWFYGHTHQSYSNIINNVLVKSNPVGYHFTKK